MPYAPESNSDEYLNSDFKTHLRLTTVSENPEQLLEKAMVARSRIEEQSHRARFAEARDSARMEAEGNSDGGEHT